MGLNYKLQIIPKPHKDTFGRMPVARMFLSILHCTLQKHRRCVMFVEKTNKGNNSVGVIFYMQK